MPAYHARIAFRSSNTGSGLQIVNVLHAEVDTLSSPPDWNSVATDVNTWLGTLYKAILPNEDTFHDITVTDEDYPGSTLGQGVKSVELVGARAPSDGKLDRSLCAVLKWKTQTTKRYARGHMFAPPIQSSADCSATGGINSAGTYGLACAAFANAYVAGSTAGSTSYIPEIFSKTRQRAGASPFTFKVTAWGSDWKQHMLRSRIK